MRPDEQRRVHGLQVYFSEAMDPPSTHDRLVLRDSAGGSVPGLGEVSGNVLTFAPAGDLDYDSRYTATVLAGAEDLAGNPLQADYVFSFTTVPELPGLGAQVEGCVPALARTTSPGNGPGGGAAWLLLALALLARRFRPGKAQTPCGPETSLGM